MFVSGMSGNEIWCLHQKGYRPGELVVGNSVVSLGVIGGMAAGVRGFTGGELAGVTQLISEGRHLAIDRMLKEAREHKSAGVTSVVSELRSFAGYIEFLSQGTSLLSDSVPPEGPFTTAAVTLPARTRSAPSAMEAAPEAHAITIVSFGPVSPRRQPRISAWE